MNEYSWMSHPAIKNLDPAKLALLVSVAESSKGKNPEMVVPILMQAFNQMKRQNLNFSKEEQDLLVEVLTENMSPEEKARVNMIKSFVAKNRR
ncbi:MAG: hypothetical protein GX995_02995 [Clostridiales bacterium]|jgi:hypothetical protein|nr:hypothetical protein [Clostridiales bacterium]